MSFSYIYGERHRCRNGAQGHPLVKQELVSLRCGDCHRHLVSHFQAHVRRSLGRLYQTLSGSHGDSPPVSHSSCLSSSLPSSAYMYTHTCIICVYVHTHMYHLRTCTHTHVFSAYMYTHTCIICLHTHTHVSSAYMYTHTCIICVHTHTHVSSAYMYTHTYHLLTCTHTHVSSAYMYTHAHVSSTYMHTHTHVSSAYMYTHTCIICVYVHTLCQLSSLIQTHAQLYNHKQTRPHRDSVHEHTPEMRESTGVAAGFMAGHLSSRSCVCARMRTCSCACVCLHTCTHGPDEYLLPGGISSAVARIALTQLA